MLKMHQPYNTLSLSGKVFSYKALFFGGLLNVSETITGKMKCVLVIFTFCG